MKNKYLNIIVVVGLLIVLTLYIINLSDLKASKETISKHMLTIEQLESKVDSLNTKTRKLLKDQKIYEQELIRVMEEYETKLAESKSR